MIFFQVEVCSVRKDYANHEAIVFDAAGCIVKCCSIELNSCALTDMECFDLGCVITKIVSYVLQRTQEKDAICSSYVDLGRSVILNCVKKSVVTCAIACLKLQLAAEKSRNIDLCRCLFKRCNRRLISYAFCGKSDLAQSFDNGCEIDVLNDSSVLFEIGRCCLVNYHKPASFIAG